MVCKTLRSESASRVSRSLDSASGRPVAADRGRLETLWAGRVRWCKDGDGEVDMRSSAEGSSSSALRLRLAGLGTLYDTFPRVSVEWVVRLLEEGTYWDGMERDADLDADGERGKVKPRCYS